MVLNCLVIAKLIIQEIDQLFCTISFSIVFSFVVAFTITYIQVLFLVFYHIIK
jgi:hypothetical protein